MVYSFLKFYKRGAAHNCLIVKHFDVQRELYGSDYNEDRVFSALIRTWARKNNIKLPDIYLWDEHWFFSMTVRSILFYLFIRKNGFELLELRIARCRD